MKHARGQIPIFVAIITAGGMIIASVFTAWATAARSVGDIKTQIGVVEERENNHYEEVQKTLIRIEGKLDKAVK